MESVLVTVGIPNRSKHRRRFQTSKKWVPGPKKSTFRASATREIIKKPLGFLVFRENRCFFSVSLIFSIFGRTNHQNEVKKGPKSRSKRSKKRSKNEIGKKTTKTTEK